MLIDTPFIRFDTNNKVQPIYMENGKNVELKIKFNSSVPIDKHILWHNSKMINTANREKYYPFICDVDGNVLYEHYCKFEIYNLNQADAGNYVAEIANYEYNLSKFVNFNISYTKPKVKILIPNDCTYYFCVPNRVHEFKCEANEYNEYHFLMAPCDSLDNCLMHNNKKFKDLLLDFHKKVPIELDNPRKNLYQINATQPYLLICAANNALGTTIERFIMIPFDTKQSLSIKFSDKNLTNALSEFKNKTFSVIENDSFIIRLDFFGQLFDHKTIFLKSPTKECSNKELQINETESMYSYYLSFKNVSLECTGEYKISFETKSEYKYLYQKVENQTFNLMVIKEQAPVFIQNLTFQSFNLNNNSYKILINNYGMKYDNNLLLDCSSTGQPLPITSWFKNQIKIPNFENAIWNLRNYELKDAANFKCVVQNRKGEIERNFYVEPNNETKLLYILIFVSTGILIIFLISTSIYVICQRKKNREFKVCSIELLLKNTINILINFI